MRGLRIEDRGPDGSLSFDLRDILALLGDDAIRSRWRLGRVECLGDEAAATFHRASETGKLVDGPRFIELAGQLRVVAGVFLGRFPDEDDFWIIIRAVGGSAYDVLCDREAVLATLENRFDRVNAVPSSAGRDLVRPSALVDQLRQAATEDPDHMVYHSYQIVEELDKAGAADLDAVRTILRFMEDNPDLDYGLPGPLVSFAERFVGMGYEEELFASLSRRPTTQTVLMLNRLINAAENIGERVRLILLLEELRDHSAAEAWIKEQIDFYLERFG